MKQKNKFYTILIIYVTIIISFYLFFAGCFGRINKHKDFINMLLEYYPEHNIKIVKSDPNMLIIQIIKGDKSNDR